MTKVDVKINLVQLILIGLGVLLLFGSGFKLHTDKVGKIKDELASEVKLKEALLDDVNTYRTKEGHWISEKRTLQLEITDVNNLLNDTVINLTDTQKELLNNIKNLKDRNNIISAALIDLEIELDSIVHDGITIVDTTNNTVTFSDAYVDSTKQFDYGLTISNVVPFPKKAIPKLRFDSLSFQNKQFIKFYWEDNKKSGYPISFSVTNSNGFFKINDIDSYVIPNIIKDNLNPDFWQRISNFMDDNKKTAMGVGVGAVAAGVLFLVISK